MRVEDFIHIVGADFYTGVPDSQLKELCDYLHGRYGSDARHHVIAANEGNAVGTAAGYYLATGRYPVVYMQNSGEGNAINPLASLLNEKVYAISCIFIIGWRGEPGVHDEPQHVFQGEITLKLLELMGVEYTIISPGTREEEVEDAMKRYQSLLAFGHSVAFVIRKGALSYEEEVRYTNENSMSREDAIKRIAHAAAGDPVVCTTGKASRELFEIRKAEGQSHEKDFLTVGSMGHASSIALGIALNTNRKVWCIDGDGALLMHMGAMATIGSCHPENMIHIVINNEAHESVGGMPTATCHMDINALAVSCGYPLVCKTSTEEQLEEALSEARQGKVLRLIEVKCSIGSRTDLGRPTITPIKNKEDFIMYLGGKR